MYGYSDNKKLGILDMVDDIYGSKASFLEFLNDSKKKKDQGEHASEFIEEFLEFVTQLAASDYKGIEFGFEFPPVKEALESQVWQRA